MYICNKKALLLNFSREHHQTEVAGSLFTIQVQYLASHFENLRKKYMDSWLQKRVPSVLKLGFKQKTRKFVRNFSM